MALTYSLATSHVGSTFLDGFNFWDTASSSSGSDPSDGFVQYYNRADAESNNLTSVDPVTGSVRLTVDTVNTYDPAGPGRPSVRLESTQQYDHGLVIGDFSHIPSTQCGLWPAFWMHGPDWPSNGEIDIIEGGSNTTRNQYSAHTSSGCSIPAEGQALGSTILNDNLDCASDRNSHKGCSVAPSSRDTTSYGMPFNAVDGGVYAMEWTSDFIKMWHFPRPQIPRDIGMDTPDPSGWGAPQAIFGGSTCDPDTFFKNMSIVININMCGTWPGAAWGQSDGCDATTGHATCADFIGNEPGLLEQAHWDVNYIKVYQATTATKATSSSSMTSTSSVEETTTTTTTVQTTVTVTVTRGSNNLTFPTAPAEAENPLKIDDYAFMGCLGTNGRFGSWSLGGTDDLMTVEKCVGTYCANRRFAGAFNNTCYCADNLGGDVEEADPSACNTRCPGDLGENCGGIANPANMFAATRRSLFARDAPSGILLSIYGAIIYDIPQQAPALGGAIPSASTTIVTSVIYTTICPTNNAMLVTSTYITTLTIPACCGLEPTVAAIHMTTCTKTCLFCGTNGENTVTLVVPESIDTSVSYIDVTATVVPMNNTSPVMVVTAGAGRVGSALSSLALILSALFGGLTFIV